MSLQRNLSKALDVMFFVTVCSNAVLGEVLTPDKGKNGGCVEPKKGVAECTHSVHLNAALPFCFTFCFWFAKDNYHRAKSMPRGRYKANILWNLQGFILQSYCQQGCWSVTSPGNKFIAEEETRLMPHGRKRNRCRKYTERASHDGVESCFRQISPLIQSYVLPKKLEARLKKARKIKNLAF